MPDYLRSGDCNHCGECCGSNGLAPTSMGYEVVRKWSLDDVSEAYNLWTLFGLGWNPVLEEIEPEEMDGFYRIQGVQYWFSWQELRPGKGRIPCKSTSTGYTGSVECPFLQDDPGDGSRPCALVDSQDVGSRHKFCRPEERPEPPPNYDIWPDYSMIQWTTDHPNCSYAFTEIVP